MNQIELLPCENTFHVVADYVAEVEAKLQKAMMIPASMMQKPDIEIIDSTEEWNRLGNSLVHIAVRGQIDWEPVQVITVKWAGEPRAFIDKVSQIAIGGKMAAYITPSKGLMFFFDNDKDATLVKLFLT